MTSSGTQTARTIAGYTLQERIGAGGYGEVWKAEAPGGLAKAVKLVYGYLGDERADCEQKSLQRIKEVRHPFLLSLERIEIVDSQLVIVTELAEGSFKDRFEECRRSEMAGIPREELLGYIRDVADALDYISEHYSLQHLDVKPENLLLLSGHAKVGDFGLVKQLHDNTMSLMGGLTPVYAAPEIFDGRPSKHSDQYSLAIVYQEMLTGVLPFPGRTPAQLAVQHASAEPRLGPLPTIERGTIARALAKKPEDRFPDCRTMVNSLAGLERSGVARTPTPVPSNALPRAETVTTPVEHADKSPEPDPASAMATVALERGTTDPPPRVQATSWSVAEVLDAAPPVEDLPPLEIAVDQQRLHPTLVLGIGGTGAQVLKHLRGKLNDRYGDASVPAIQMMLLDTDQSEIANATHGNPRTALASSETLALPLRHPQNYRSDAGKHLAWLSRRWLYNIPRSLKTQGLRPLGRLALVDHAQAVVEQLRETLAAVTEPDTMTASAEAVGVAPGDRTPRVYLVASISGGTGGGMVLDVAAMVRKVLAELDLSDEYLLGMLTHSTSRRPKEHDLAIANAYACLSELHHYHRTGNYPGDTACHLPSTDQDFPTFQHTYLVPFGESLDEQQFSTATDAVAQYLYLNAVTPAGEFFEKHRRTDEGTGCESVEPVHIRTFGLTRIGCSSGDLPDVATEALCRQVVARWQGEDSPADPQTEQAAELLCGMVELDPRALVVQALNIVCKELGGRSEAVVPDRAADDAEAGSSVWTVLQRTLNMLPTPDDPDSDLEDLSETLAPRMEWALRKTGARQGDAVAEWVLQWANDSPAGVAAARRGAEWFTGRLQSMEADIQQALDTTEVQLRWVQPLLVAPTTPGQDSNKSGRGWFGFGHKSDQIVPPKDQYYRLRLSRFVLGHVKKALWVVRQRTVAAGDRLGELSHALSLLADQFPDRGRLHRIASDANPDATETERQRQHIAGTLDRQIDAMADDVMCKVRAGALAEHGLRKLADRQHDVLEDLTVTLRASSRAAVLQALRQSDVARQLLYSDQGLPEAIGRMDAALENAEPALTECGGTRRLVAVTPDAELPRISQDDTKTARPTPSVVLDSDADLTLCYEMARLPARRAAALLIDHRSDYQQVATRLHTRIDVQWSDFDQP